MLIRSCTGRREGEVCSMLCDDPQAEGRRQLLAESSYMSFVVLSFSLSWSYSVCRSALEFPGSLDIFALSKFH